MSSVFVIYFLLVICFLTCHGHVWFQCRLHTQLVWRNTGVSAIFSIHVSRKIKDTGSFIVFIPCFALAKGFLALEITHQGACFSHLDSHDQMPWTWQFIHPFPWPFVMLGINVVLVANEVFVSRKLVSKISNSAVHAFCTKTINNECKMCTFACTLIGI